MEEPPSSCINNKGSSTICCGFCCKSALNNFLLGILLQRFPPRHTEGGEIRCVNPKEKLACCRY